MRTISGIVDAILGRSFEIHCISIKVRGQGANIHSNPYFSGPGSITGDAEGHFHFHLYDTLEHDSKELIRLTHVAAEGTEPMAIDADDYEGTHWTGAWFIPKIQVSTATGRCFVMGEFPQLSTRISFTNFDQQRNTTTIHYSGALKLPMLKASQIQKLRGADVERVSVYWDRSDLDFKGASVRIQTDEEKDCTTLSTTYRDGWQPPYCEVGLSDAFAFVTATSLRPRITVRGLESDAIVFVRFTPEEPRTGMPRPIIGLPSERAAFWNLFLAFLRDCEEKKEFYSTRLSRLFSELVPASTGTIHGFILSLVVAIEDLVDQIADPVTSPTGIEELKTHVQTWTGDDNMKKRAVAVLSSFLGKTSTNENLRKLVRKGVVTEEQRKLWNDLRNKVAVAHGRLVDYDDEKLMEKRNQLITMFYRLALQILKYRGPITDYSKTPPTELSFQWDD